MGEFSPTKQNGDCEEIANLSTAYGSQQICKYLASSMNELPSESKLLTG
jgi:hypothetical protein